MAPAKTGRASKSKTVVTNTDQGKRGILSTDIPIHRIFKIVLIKLIAPIIEETPAKWREKIAASTDAPE